MNSKNKKRIVHAAIGLGAGFLNGLFGSGGGALVVPASQRFLDTETHEAHAGAIGIMLPMTAVSAAFYAFQTKPDVWQVLAASAGGLAGGVLGAKLLPKLSPAALHKIFGIFLLTAAVRMIL